MKRLLLALIPVLFVVGCKDGPTTKGDPDAETPPDVTHVRRIGAAGGELVSDDGQVTVRVPAGALSEDVTLEIHRVPAASWPEEANTPQFRPVSSTVYQLLPSGQTFDEPVQIIHRVPPASLGGSAANGRYPAAQHVSRTQSGSLERHSTSTFHGRNSAAAVGSIRHFSYHWLTLPEESTVFVDPMSSSEEIVEVFVGNELGLEGFEIVSTYETTAEVEIQIAAHTFAGGPLAPFISNLGSATPVQDDPRFHAAYAAATGEEAPSSVSYRGEVM